jgi:formylglycine-generating enzyme required for sulfatase activity
MAESQSIRRHRAWLYFSGVAVVLVVVGVLTFQKHGEAERLRQHHLDRGDRELVISGTEGRQLEIFRSGTSLDDASPGFAATNQQWLPQGNYFLRAISTVDTLYFPIALTVDRSHQPDDNPFSVTVRPKPTQTPPRLFAQQSDFVYIPSGTFLFGDRLNPQEAHEVWLTGFFIGQFEATNEEFRAFLRASDGYENDSNWTVAGTLWKHSSHSQTSALLGENDAQFPRFGKPDQPVTRVNWFEANAYCRWLTKNIGHGQWWYSLPTEGEWEKAARGPDNFDYALSKMISDNEVQLYNWKKNPDAPVTVVGILETPQKYGQNRYGLFHMTGNVLEWTQSAFIPFNKSRPYVDDERNYDTAAGLRVARGGSWYSGSIAYLSIPYRDAFQPEHSSQETGFRVVARRVP